MRVTSLAVLKYLPSAVWSNAVSRQRRMYIALLRVDAAKHIESDTRTLLKESSMVIVSRDTCTSINLYIDHDDHNQSLQLRACLCSTP